MRAIANAGDAVFLSFAVVLALRGGCGHMRREECGETADAENAFPEFCSSVDHAGRPWARGMSDDRGCGKCRFPEFHGHAALKGRLQPRRIRKAADAEDAASLGPVVTLALWFSRGRGTPFSSALRPCWS